MRTVSPRKSCNSSILAWESKAKLKVKMGNIGRHTETQRTEMVIHSGLFLIIQTWDIDTTELSSLIASSTNKRLGRDLFFNIAVASSSLSQRKLQEVDHASYNLSVETERLILRLQIDTQSIRLKKQSKTRTKIHQSWVVLFQGREDSFFSDSPPVHSSLSVK